ncbi:MAG TPA: TIGR03435 family protein [Vicinamibacterales bacterium]
MKRAMSMASLAGVLALTGIVSAQQPQTQEPKKDPAFDVASVKLSDPNATGLQAMIPMILPQGPGRLSATNVPFRLLVRMAYQVQDFQIVSGPSWQTSQKFDIVAKADASNAADTSQLMPMLKALLADRFKLKTHTETREMPIDTLVIARNDGRLGPNLRPSTSDCKSPEAQQEQQKRAQAATSALKGDPSALAGLLGKPGEVVPCSMMPMIGGLQGPAAGGTPSFGLRGNGQPLTVLVQILSQATGKTVQDKTGLSGLYDFELTFDPAVFLRAASQLGINLPQPAVGVNQPPSDTPSLLTALREQLGLKLDSIRGPVEVLVIDSAEMPMPD